MSCVPLGVSWILALSLVLTALPWTPPARLKDCSSNRPLATRESHPAALRLAGRTHAHLVDDVGPPRSSARSEW